MSVLLIFLQLIRRILFLVVPFPIFTYHRKKNALKIPAHKRGVGVAQSDFLDTNFGQEGFIRPQI